MTDPSLRCLRRHSGLQIRFSKAEITSLIAIIAICSVPFLAHSLVRTTMARRSSGNRRSSRSAALSQSVSVQASQRGNPSLVLSDGHELLTSYVGADDLRAALENNQAEPLSLTSADFDEDGVPDLVGGYSYEGQGIVTLMRGNVDAIYPNAAEAQQRRAGGTFSDAPFLSPTSVFAAPIVADFIGAGDFDADSHWDVVVGSISSHSLYLLSGDGHGKLALTKVIQLPGAVTAMTTGEINRADGLTDIVAGVDGPDGSSSVLVFEGPGGALRAQPEVFPMPTRVSALALGQLDSSYEMDLAIGAGTELTLLRGRDRKLSLDAEQQQKVSVAQTEERIFDAEIKSLTIGDFAENHQPALALLTSNGRVEVVTSTVVKATAKTKSTAAEQLTSWSERSLNVAGSEHARRIVRAKTSSTPGDDLLILSQSQIQVVSNIASSNTQTANLEAASEAVAVLPMRLNPDARNDLVLLRTTTSLPSVVQTDSAQIFVVNSTADTNDGQCTVAANGCTLREAINAANGNPGADTIKFNIPGNAPYTIGPTSRLPVISESLTIDGTSQPGFAGAPIIEVNGTNAGAGSFGFGLEAAGNTFRGLVINHFDAPGLYVTTINGGHIVEGNYIGTNISGTAAAPNRVSGIQFDSGNNVIGGTVVAARNVIAGNNGFAIFMPNLNCIGNLIEGNFIGTDATGHVVLGGNGIQISSNGAKNNTIGGTTAQARNIISTGRDPNLPETAGIDIGGTAAGNLVQGNYVGTDVTGTVALGNGTGVSMNQSPNNTVGGTVSSARNVVSASQFAGVFLYQPQAMNNLVQGNYIGTDVTGTQPLGNITNGVGMGGCNHNTIGGVVAGAGNLISANLNGVHLYFAENVANHDNTVQGNLIGTDVTGSVALGNHLAGVDIQNADSNLIGGNTAGARNVISGNLDSGFAIYGGPTGAQGQGSANNNRIEGNYVGTNAAGTAKLANARDGIAITITQGSAANTIGGATADKRNIISGNGRNGIAIGIHLVDPLTGQPLPGTGGTGITIQNNYVGTDVTGNNCLGNTQDGIFVDADSQINTISDNLVTCNGRNGVFIPQNSNPGVRIFLDNNSIFANSSLGIDLGLAGITANDPLDTDTGANFQQNFPALTSVSPVANSDKPDLGIDALTINGTLNSAPNQTFTVHWYFSAGQCTSNQAGNHPLVTGKVPGVSTNGNGDAQFSFPFDFPNGVNDGIINCTATDGQGNTSEFSSCFSVNAAAAPPSVGLDAPSYSAAENVGVKTVNVTRAGSTAAACSVNYTTSDTAGASPCDSFNTGKASSRCDYETTLGTLKFAAGETSKTISIPVIDDAYNEGNEALTITLSNPVNVSLGAQSTAPITIIDDSTPAQNPINDATFFTKLHYFDFLNREADTPGLNFWRNEITSCGSDTTCTEVHRISVSASFFLSIEFKETGYLVERAYKASYGDIEKDSSYPPPVHKLKLPIIRFQEFLADTQQITEGVVVLAPGWEQKLESNKVAFFADFVQRARFTTALPTTVTPAQFVDQLNTNAGNVLSTSERTTAINLFGGAGNTTNTTARAQALRQVAEDADLATAEINRAFVLMQYYGYLRRNPDDPPEASLDYAGYEFWLIKLNLFGGDYSNAEMVKAFLSSIEYNRRFGP
jgi:CSLREA domain-containing protein